MRMRARAWRRNPRVRRHSPKKDHESAGWPDETRGGSTHEARSSLLWRTREEGEGGDETLIGAGGVRERADAQGPAHGLACLDPIPLYAVVEVEGEEVTNGTGVPGGKP